MNNKTNTFTVLESTLQMLGGEKYLPVFKQFNINTQTFALLTEEDLITIGIDDEELRKKLLELGKNLPQKKDYVEQYKVTDDYALSVMQDNQKHIQLLQSSLSICLLRKDVLVSDVKLSKYVKTLISSNNLCEKELQQFQQFYFPEMKTNFIRRKWKYLIPLLISSAASVYILKKYFF